MENITTEIKQALQQLGYKVTATDIVEFGKDRYLVRLNGTYFGVWDSMKHTFVD